ncbi:GMC family oxidoreductase [soil metagenome]
MVEEGPWVDPGALEPFSLDEMVAKYRHQGGAAALGAPPVAYAEGRCVGGSTEINSGLWHRLPDALADDWRERHQIEEFTPEALGRYADRIEEELTVSKLPGAPPESSAVLARGADALDWRSVEFARVFRYDQDHRGVKQTMARTFIPAAVDAGATMLPDCRVDRLLRSGDRIVGVRCTRRRPDGTDEDLTLHADHVIVCGGAIQTPALLQRSGLRRNIGGGIQLHPTIRVAARFRHALDHADVPMHRITEFGPGLEIGGSASRRSHVALALSDSTADYDDAMDDWEKVAVYYAATHDGVGRVTTLPGLRAPLVTYRLSEGDMSRLGRGLVLLGEALLAAGATELYPSMTGAPVVRRREDLVSWWDAVTRSRTNLMTVHMTSSVRIGEDRDSSGADSYGRIWGMRNLRVNDASLLPDAPGVNPQSTIMTLALRNADQFLADG